MNSSQTIDYPAPARSTFRPQPYGWLLLFLLMWIPLAAVVTVNNFLWIVFTMMIGIGATSHVLAGKSLASITFSRRFPEEIYASAPFPVRYFARSQFGKWGSFGFALQEKGALKGQTDSVAFPQIPPGDPTEVTGYFSIHSRGDVKIGPATISSTFPFGLARYSRACGSSDTVLVFPMLVAVEDEIPAWLGGVGKGLERSDPFGTVPYLFRDYVPGDRYKHIDWKKTARTGSLVTRILSDEGAREIAVKLPAGASERAISRAASLVVYFLKSGRPVSLEGPRLKTEPGVGREFGRYLLTLLARWDNTAQVSDKMSDSRGISVEIDEQGEFRWEESDERHEPGT